MWKRLSPNFAHLDGELTLQQYFDAIVKSNQDYDLPGAVQNALVNDDDSDSESETEELGAEE